MKKLVLILVIISVFSCAGENAEVKLENNTDEIQIDTVSDESLKSVNNVDTVALITNSWESVYYIKKGDTIFSKVPFIIEFLKKRKGLFYTINKQSDSTQTWKYSDRLFQTSGSAVHCYHILELTDESFRTRDTSSLGFEYCFKRI